MTCKVCDLCYKLIMTENQLEEVKLINIKMFNSYKGQLDFV